MPTRALQLNPALINTLARWSADPGAALPDLLAKAGASQTWQLLATPISGLRLNEGDEPEITVALLDKTGKHRATQGGWTWNSSASASAALTIDVLDDEQAKSLGMVAAEGHAIVRYAAGLDLGAKTSGQRPLGAWGSAGASASLGAGSQMAWYVQAPRTQLLFMALQEATAYTRLPNELEALLALAGERSFWGLSLNLSGELAASFQAQVQAASTGWTYGLDGERVAIGLAVRGGLSGSLAVKGGMRLEVRPEQNPITRAWGLRVELHTTRSRSGSLAAEVGAALDLSALAQNAEKVLRAALPEVDAERLNRLTLPGTALGEHLQQAITRHVPQDLLAQAAQLLLGQGDETALREAVLAPLATRIGDFVDTQAAAVAQQQTVAEEAVSAWLQRLFGTGTATRALREALQQATQEALAEASGRMKGELETLAERVQGQTGAAVDAVLRPLGALGQEVAAALQALDTNAASKAVREGVARYHAKREKLLSALGDAAKAKIGATLALKVAWSRGGTLAFSARFMPSTELAAAHRLYQAVCSGRIALPGELIDAAAAEGSVEDASGWLTETAKLIRSGSLELNLFGADFSAGASRLLDMAFKTDAWGRLVAAKTLAEAESHIRNRWLQRRAALSFSAQWASEDAGSGTLETALAGAYTAGGRRTTRRWVQSVADHHAVLVGGRMGADVAALLDAPADSDVAQAKAFWQSVTVGLTMDFSGEAWERFMARPADEVKAAFLRHTLRCMDREYADKTGFERSTPSAELLLLAQDVLGVPGGGGLDAWRLAYLDRFSTRPAARTTSGDWERVGMGAMTVSGGLSARSSMHVRYVVFHRLAAVVRSAARLQTLAGELPATLTQAPAGTPPAALRRQVERPLRGMADALALFAVASTTLSGLGLLGAEDDGVHWTLHGFALAMAELCETSVPLPMATAPGRANHSAVPLMPLD